jgi:hypothetical protein
LLRRGKGRVMKCEICGAENPPSMNHTSMHTCICVDCCRDQKPEWQKRAEEAEVELAKALAEIEHLKHQLEDESMRADGMTTAHAEAGAKNYRQQELIEQMREALQYQCFACTFGGKYDSYKKCQLKCFSIKALSAAERGE